jgi:hypothetical protein
MSSLHLSFSNLPRLEPSHYSPSSSSSSSASWEFRSAEELCFSESQSDVTPPRSPIKEEPVSKTSSKSKSPNLSDACNPGRVEELSLGVHVTPKVINLPPPISREEKTAHEQRDTINLVARKLPLRRKTICARSCGMASPVLVSIEPLSDRVTQLCYIPEMNLLEDGTGQIKEDQIHPGLRTTRLGPTILDGTPSPIEPLPLPLVMSQPRITTKPGRQYGCPSAGKTSAASVGLGIGLPSDHPLRTSHGTTLLQMSASFIPPILHSPLALPSVVDNPKSNMRPMMLDRSPSPVELLPSRLCDYNITGPRNTTSPSKHPDSKSPANAKSGSPPARTPREGYRRKCTSPAQRYSHSPGITYPLGLKSLQGKTTGDKARLESATILENLPPNIPLSPKPLRNRYKVLLSPSRKAQDKELQGSASLVSTLPGTSPYQSGEYALPSGENASKLRLQPTNLPESPSPTQALPSPRLFRSFQPTSTSILARGYGIQ